MSSLIFAALLNLFSGWYSGNYSFSIRNLTEQKVKIDIEGVKDQGFGRDTQQGIVTSLELNPQEIKTFKVAEVRKIRAFFEKDPKNYREFSAQEIAGKRIEENFNFEVTPEGTVATAGGWNPGNVSYLPKGVAQATIDDQAVAQSDSERLIPFIKKYAPILYLHQHEVNLPIAATELFTGPDTALAAQGQAEPIVPKGKVTMQGIYDLYKKTPNHRDEKYYFDISNRVQSGSDPVLNRDAQNNLTTPAYVLTFNEGNKTYIQYMFLFGYNAPYPIGPLAGDKADFQNAHETDCEHMTMELDANSKKLLRIFYGSHGRTEGAWLDAQHPDVMYENSNPVALLAKGGHGCYPQEGTYVRIFGMANDITSKGRKWTPNLVRVFKEGDTRFDPKSMGWLYHPGTYGKRGVAPAWVQGWFGSTAGDIGRSYDGDMKKLYCKPGDTLCVIRKAPEAKLPA